MSRMQSLGRHQPSSEVHRSQEQIDENGEKQTSPARYRKSKGSTYFEREQLAEEQMQTVWNAGDLEVFSFSNPGGGWLPWLAINVSE